MYGFEIKIVIKIDKGLNNLMENKLIVQFQEEVNGVEFYTVMFLKFTSNLEKNLFKYW